MKNILLPFFTRGLGRVCRWLPLVFLLAASPVFAQKTTIFGQVLDQNGAELPGATVILLQPKDSVMAAFSITDAAGNFRFAEVAPGSFLLQVGYLGFEAKWQKLDVFPQKNDLNLGKIMLSSNPATLQAVEILGERDPLRFSKDTVEYNAAAFVTPKQGLLGLYRKSRLFPLTEYVPAWLDGPTFRRLLPWTGTWQVGSGARVFPLSLRDGREIPVLPLICLDDVDTSLAINGARLGAQAILTMSNDSWFTRYPQGAALHQAVAAFRSIETRRPQFRVTNNGYSAAIDARGNIIAGSRLGERTLVIGDLPVAPPPLTLMVRWGDWLGWVCAAFLALLATAAILPRWHPHADDSELTAIDWSSRQVNVSVLPLPVRVLAGLLRAFARCGLLWMALLMLLDDGLRANTLAQIRLFSGLFLLPEAAARFLLLAFAAKASIENGQLLLRSGTRQLALPLSEIAAARLWWLPLPGPGLSLQLTSGTRWRYALALRNPATLARALTPDDTAPATPAPLLTLYTRARELMRQGRFEHPVLKFIFFPLLLALPAFRLHQHIAYGSSFGEYYSFGLKAYLTTLGLWWATWAIGVATSAAILRLGIETLSFLAARLRPQHAIDSRYLIERMGLVALYLGMPVWLVWRMTGAN